MNYEIFLFYNSKLIYLSIVHIYSQATVLLIFSFLMFFYLNELVIQYIVSPLGKLSQVPIILAKNAV